VSPKLERLTVSIGVTL